MIKENIEFISHEDGSYLNFWDWAHGNDVTAEIKENGQLFIDGDDASYSKPVTFPEFLNLVKESINKRTV